MVTQHKHELSSLSVLDAVEILTNIADLKWNKEAIVMEPEKFIEEKKIAKKAIPFTSQKEQPHTISLIKEIFKVILDYLQNFYRSEDHFAPNPTAEEGVRTIMVIVGEAAKKLDTYKSLFEKARVKSITGLPEYKRLQEFYLSKIARKIDDSTLSKWLLELTKRAWDQSRDFKITPRKTMQTKHVFVDLDSVKKDTEYELFMLRKEDAARFYSPRLIRNIKLVCDFGEHFGKTEGFDPLQDIQIWQNKCFAAAAKGILAEVDREMRKFYQQALQFKDREVVEHINKAFMALMLCVNSQQWINNHPTKSSKEYFTDFQHYLRSALISRDYLKLIAYPPKQSSKLANTLLETIHGLCTAMYTSLRFYQPILAQLENMILDAVEHQSPEHIKAAEASHFLWNRLAGEHKAIEKHIKGHASGPLVKVLDILESDEYSAYDPFILQYLPSRLYALRINDHTILNLNIPSPTAQEFINKAAVIDEFKGFLRNCHEGEAITKHLMINLQDRTSWREHSRCVALEELQKHEGFEEKIIVVTLPKDTEFYHQLEPYYQENHADVFIENLKSHINDLSTGFYVPESLLNNITPRLIDGITAEIHRIFFSGKNVLLREHRLDFIELFYLFLELKLIEVVKPDSFSLTCKDGIDVSAAANALLFCVLKMINGEELTPADRTILNQILYAPALMQRERSINTDRFNRMISALKCVESVQHQLGRENFSTMIHDAFGIFYKTPILKSGIVC